VIVARCNSALANSHVNIFPQTINSDAASKLKLPLQLKLSMLTNS
jgi:hypothetical protein